MNSKKLKLELILKITTSAIIDVYYNNYIRAEI